MDPVATHLQSLQTLQEQVNPGTYRAAKLVLNRTFKGNDSISETIINRTFGNSLDNLSEHTLEGLNKYIAAISEWKKTLINTLKLGVAPVAPVTNNVPQLNINKLTNNPANFISDIIRLSSKGLLTHFIKTQQIKSTSLNEEIKTTKFEEID